jgi:hypothetical protein
MDKYNNNRIDLMTSLGGPLGWEDEVLSMNDWLRFWLYRTDFIPALWQSAFCYCRKKPISYYRIDFEDEIPVFGVKDTPVVEWGW